MTEPLTPVSVEAKLRQLVTEITRCQQNLAQARDGETECELVYKKAKLVAAHTDGVPVPRRGSSTVAERDEWIDAQCFDSFSAYRRATTAREIAQDALRATLAITDTVQSIGASVRTAYAMAGHA